MRQASVGGLLEAVNCVLTAGDGAVALFRAVIDVAKLPLMSLLDWTLFLHVQCPPKVLEQ